MDLPTTSSRPPEADCSGPAQNGLFAYDDVDNMLYVCDGFGGWKAH